MEAGIYLVLIALMALFVYSRFKPVKGLRTLNAEAFQAELGKHCMLIDVREAHEFRGGYIPGATNIPLSQLQNRLYDIPKDQRILLYCRSGMRSKSAARLLLKNDYADLAHLQGGLGGWNGKLTRT